jgi:hypothetical protein
MLSATTLTLSSLDAILTPHNADYYAVACRPCTHILSALHAYHPRFL